MTTNATQPAKTAKDPVKPLTTGSAKTAPSTQLGSKPSSLGKPLGSKLQEPKPEPKQENKAPEEKLTFHKEKFADYKLVRMYLLQDGCIQYDPSFPELVLNTSDKRGKLLPLTPFFKSRIGVTLELVL